MNVHELWYYIQPVCHTMEKLAAISSAISNVSIELLNYCIKFYYSYWPQKSPFKSNAKGGNTLSILHNVALNSVSGSYDQEMCIFLTSRAAAPYLESIQKWIFQGEIYDPYDEVSYLNH